MNPEKLTAELRRIASAIMASNAPSRVAVRRDLEGLVRRVAMNEYHYKCTKETCNKRFLLPLDTAKSSGISCPICKSPAEKQDDRAMNTSDLSAFAKEQKGKKRRDEKTEEDTGEDTGEV